MVGLLLLHLGHDLDVLFSVIECLTLYLLDIVVSGWEWLLYLLNFRELGRYVLLESLFLHLRCFILLLQSLPAFIYSKFFRRHFLQLYCVFLCWHFSCWIWNAKNGQTELIDWPVVVVPLILYLQWAQHRDQPLHERLLVPGLDGHPGFPRPRRLLPPDAARRELRAAAEPRLRGWQVERAIVSKPDTND